MVASFRLYRWDFLIIYRPVLVNGFCLCSHQVPHEFQPEPFEMVLSSGLCPYMTAETQTPFIADVGTFFSFPVMFLGLPFLTSWLCIYFSQHY